MSGVAPAACSNSTHKLEGEAKLSSAEDVEGSPHRHESDRQAETLRPEAVVDRCICCPIRPAAGAMESGSRDRRGRAAMESSPPSGIVRVSGANCVRCERACLLCADALLVRPSLLRTVCHELCFQQPSSTLHMHHKEPQHSNSTERERTQTLACSCVGVA
jgi:hypothetical protein